MAADFLALGLEATDKLLDKGFPKLPIVSPLGQNSPSKSKHPQKSGNTDQQQSRRRHRSVSSSSCSSYDSRDDGRHPPYPDDRARTRDSNRTPRDDRRRSPDRGRERDGYEHSGTALARGHAAGDRPMDGPFYDPNPAYYASPHPRRPRILTHRSQSQRPPRGRSRDSLGGSAAQRPRSNSSKGVGERFLSNPVATGAVGAAVGGLLANQTGRGGKDEEEDEVLVTLAGMVLGGVGSAFVSEQYKKRKEREAREHLEWERRVARRDWEREGHEWEEEGRHDRRRSYDDRTTGYEYEDREPEHDYRMSGGR